MTLIDNTHPLGPEDVCVSAIEIAKRKEAMSEGNSQNNGSAGTGGGGGGGAGTNCSVSPVPTTNGGAGGSESGGKRGESRVGSVTVDEMGGRR